MRGGKRWKGALMIECSSVQNYVGYGGRGAAFGMGWGRFWVL